MTMDGRSRLSGASRHKELDPAAVAAAACEAIARHQLDRWPILPEEHGRILDIRCLHLDAASLPRAPVRNLEMKRVTRCIRIVFDRLMIAPHPVSPLSCVEAGQLWFANWIFVRRDCGAENFASRRDIFQVTPPLIARRSRTGRYALPLADLPSRNRVTITSCGSSAGRRVRYASPEDNYRAGGNRHKGRDARRIRSRRKPESPAGSGPAAAARPA
jgi:hypothetical protein